MLRVTFRAFVILNVLVFGVLFWPQNTEFTSSTTTSAGGQQLMGADDSFITSSSLSSTLVHHRHPSSSSSWSHSGRIGKPNLVIMGCVKNAAKDLPRLKVVIDHIIQQHFQPIKMIFFENDSTDSTVDILKSWNFNNNNNDVVVQVVSETNVHNNIVERTERLAYARNRLWQELQKDEDDGDSNIDFVLMMDMDEVNFHLAHVDQCFAPTGGLPDDWTVCCANQYTMHYDLLALRTMDDWVVDDVLHGYPTPTGKADIPKLLRHIPASADPILTKSCFGGAALYKYPSIKHLPLGTFYSGMHPSSKNKSYPICEHVNFHERIQQQEPSAKFYIQPKMMNDGPMYWRRNRRRSLQPQVDKSWADPTMERFYRTRFDYDDLRKDKEVH